MAADGKWWRGWKQTLTHSLTHARTQEKNSKLDILTKERVIHLHHTWPLKSSTAHLIRASPQLLRDFNKLLEPVLFFFFFFFPVISVSVAVGLLLARTSVGVRWSVEGGRHQQEKMWDILICQPQLHSSPSGRKNSVTSLTVPLTTPHCGLHTVIHHRKSRIATCGG